MVFMLFCGAVVYLLFSGNPYLYSHLELRSALMVNEVKTHHTIPVQPAILDKVSPPTFYSRYNFERTAVDHNSSPRHRAYEEYETHNVDLGLDEFEVSHVADDDTGFYLSGKSPWVVAIGVDGQLHWKYRFTSLTEDHSIFPILLDEARAYLIHPSGEVVALDKNTGALQFLMDLHQEVVAPPFIWGKNLVVPVKGQTGVEMVNIHRSDGQMDPNPQRIDIKPGFLLSHSSTLTGVIATVDNKVMALNPENWSVLWTQTLTDPIRGPAVIVDHDIFLSTLGAKIVRLDASKKGKIDWEADLEKPAASPPTLLPIMGKLSVLDTAGGLQVLDIRTGKQAWRAAIDNRNPLNETWSARLKGNNIEEFKMDWLHKGWTIWSPCSEKRFCIYTPGKGQQIQTVRLSAAPLSLPLSGDHSWTFIGQGKPGHLIVSRVLEEVEIKRLKAEAAKANP